MTTVIDNAERMLEMAAQTGLSETEICDALALALGMALGRMTYPGEAHTAIIASGALIGAGAAWRQKSLRGLDTAMPAGRG